MITLVIHISLKVILEQRDSGAIIIIDIYIAHIAEASRRLETEGGVEMT